MPQPRILDFGPDPLTTILGNFGRGVADQTLPSYEKKQEKDFIKDIYKQINGGKSPEDALQNIIGKKGANISQLENVNKVLQGAKKIGMKKKLLKAGLPEHLADIYSEATIGGQTELIKFLKKQSEWNPDILNSLDVLTNPGEQPSPEAAFLDGAEEGAEMEKDFLFANDRKLPPEKRFERQEKRYATQMPLIQENDTALAALEREGSSMSLLNELNNTGKVGTGASRLNINPKTGDLIIPALASPEEQLFAKTVNDFTVNAKDSFGARVTNFELDRFMQRLPTLANSVEGRGLIIRQMSIVNKLNQLEKQEIRNIFDKYGVRNIDYTEAQRLARNKIGTEKDILKKEYLQLESLSKQEDSARIDQLKKKTPQGHVLMRSPEGKMKYYPKQNVKILKEKGYTPL